MQLLLFIHGGRAINDIWIEEAKTHVNWLVVTSLGVLRYLSAVKYSKALIGNSSSGIVEAPTLGVPTVNIGSRQKGRMLADSVISCKPLYNGIVMSIQKALTAEFQEIVRKTKSPFGDGTTSVQIENKVIEYLDGSISASNEKHFFDISFDTDNY